MVRRTLTVYTVSVLVTFLLGTVVTFGFLRQDLETDAHARLLAAARLYGLGVSSRLTHADQVLERLATVPVARPDQFHPQLEPESPFAAVRFVRTDSADGERSQGDEQTRAQQLAGMAEQTIRSNQRDSTIELARDGSDTRPVLVRQARGANRLFVIGWIRPDYLWGSNGKLSAGMQLCVNGARGSFRICRPRDDELGSANVDEGSQSRLTVRYPLLLRVRCCVDEWSVEASQLQANILTPRWMHARKGLIPPAEFIPVAEASGLIVPIGRWVLEESCRRMLEWRRADVYLDHIAVNMSLRQLQNDSFLEYLSRYLAVSGIDGRLLELEVTESMFAQQPAHLSRTLEQIRRRGVRIAIDDFGTGYSSLALLQLLPIDVLKIDRAFVSEIESGTGDAIVRATIALGLALGKDLVAEGVETQAQARALTQHGCHSAQGFVYAPALVADELVRFVRGQQSLLERGEPHARRA
jgi:EAL domain-containing protein (putative c-di-GMP-specific phosphodiesterase class I)